MSAAKPEEDSGDYIFADEPWRGDLEGLVVEAEGAIADLDWETRPPAQLLKDIDVAQGRLRDIQQYLKKIEPKTEGKKPVVKAQPAEAGVVVVSSSSEAKNKRKSSEDKESESSSSKRAKRTEFKETPAFVVFDDPGDPYLSWFTKGHVHKYYVCATKKLAKEKKRQMEDECAGKFFEWLQSHKDELVVKGKPKRAGGVFDGRGFDLNIGWSLSIIPSFKTAEAATAFANFIQAIRDGKAPQSNEACKAMCLAMLRPDFHIEKASISTTD